MITITDENKMVAQKTARSSGAVGKNSIVSRVVLSLTTNKDKILDYGAGKGQDVEKLKEDGRNVMGYDFTYMYPFIPDLNLVKPEFFNVIYSSNVLNVLSTTNDIYATLTEVCKYLKEDGLYIANYPSSPRKCSELTEKYLRSILRSMFYTVIVKKYSSGIVFICQK